MTSGEPCAVAGTRQILVMNGKGGCGKTTVATNLAVAYAAQGKSVILVDRDPQGSSAHWGAQRSPELPAVPVVRADERCIDSPSLRELATPAAGAERIIVDGHTGMDERELQWLIRQADVLLVPIQPSSIDIRVGSRFITQVLTHRRFRATPKPLGVLANRVQPNAQTHAKLQHFLDCLGHPVVTTFRDSPVYSEAIETGKGVVDMVESRAARKETPAWRAAIAWIDSQAVRVRRVAGQVRREPVAAGRHTSRESTLSA